MRAGHFPVPASLPGADHRSVGSWLVGGKVFAYAPQAGETGIAAVAAAAMKRLW